MASKIDAEDFSAFLGLLPKSWHGLPLRHALEVRHPSFACKAFIDLARNHGAAVVYAQGGSFRKSACARPISPTSQSWAQA